jgi:trimethylamine--corrinoid protein Co-methyltransferase
MCAGDAFDPEAFDAIAGVEPGGHFFASPHTMTRYDTAFYAPLVADLSNFGTWQAGGGLTAEERATSIWQDRVAAWTPPQGSAEIADRLARPLAALRQSGGAIPMEG